MNTSTPGVATSSDGITWTSQTPSNTTTIWKSICWSPDLSLYVAVGGQSTSSYRKVMTSSDGINWTDIQEGSNVSL